MSEIPRLIYFDVRGRAEPIPLLLEEAGEPWEEELYTLCSGPVEGCLHPFVRR